jgi:hypothetical protein
LYNVIELILDRGLVIDVFVRVSLVGIELLTGDARVVVASVADRCAGGCRRAGAAAAVDPPALHRAPGPLDGHVEVNVKATHREDAVLRDLLARHPEVRERNSFAAEDTAPAVHDEDRLGNGVAAARRD